MEREQRDQVFLYCWSVCLQMMLHSGVLLHVESIFDEVTIENGLALSIPKTKLLVAGIVLTDDDLAPLQLDGGVVEVVEQFKYSGSLVDGIAGKVSCTFGSLNDSVFTASDLMVETKRIVY